MFKGTTLRGMLLNASQPSAWCIPARQPTAEVFPKLNSPGKVMVS